MSTPAITKADLERLSAEVADGDKQEWLDQRGIEVEAFLWTVDQLHRSFLTMLSRDPDVYTAVGGVAGFAFQMGFEAAEQFRPAMRRAA